jgi:soluble lytic murein transglycosylase-like protein
VGNLFPYLAVAALTCGPGWCDDTRRLASICSDFYADRYGVPRELVHAIIEVESAWQPHAVSAKGAVGLMQLMPSTAVMFGVHNRFRIEENIQGGVAYLSRLQRRFQGDLRLVTAAYFAGESRITSHGLSYSSPQVHHYVSQVARVYRRRRMEAIGIGALKGESD